MSRVVLISIYLHDPEAGVNEADLRLIASTALTDHRARIVSVSAIDLDARTTENPNGVVAIVDLESEAS